VQVKCIHDTYVQINHKKIRNFLSNLFNMTFHVNVKVQKQSKEDPILEYISKNNNSVTENKII
jgi:hypothetical protein